MGTLKSKAAFLDSDTNEHILKMLLLDADHYVYNRNVFFNYFGDSQVLSKLNVSFKNNILDIIQQ